MSRERSADLQRLQRLARRHKQADALDPYGYDQTATVSAKPGKGDMLCNRTACQTGLHINHRWWNSSTRAFYCAACARRINEASPGLCVLET